MCVVCGCNDPERAGTPRASGDDRRPALAHPAVDPRTGDLHYGAGAARVSVPGISQARAIRLEADVLGENRRLAALNRVHFEGHGVAAYNLVSSPGSGKTTLLCATIEALRRRAPAQPLAVIEGDQQTSNDADRIRATGAPAIQVNTGKGCHLDAQMVGEAFGRLPLHSHGHGHGDEQPGGHRHDHTHARDPVQGRAGHVHDHHPDHDHHDHDHDHDHHAHDEHHHHDDPAPGAPAAILFIENVGNLVCPALWDLGERAKVVILSVTEGEDKPLKYPDMFAAAQLMVLNKTDLLPHLDFDVQRCVEFARRVNPGIEVLQVSAKTGQGLDAWIDWLLQTPAPANQTAPAAPAVGRESEGALRARIAHLEALLAQSGHR